MGDRVIAALAAVFAAWRGPDKRWREALAEALPVYSPEVIEDGVRQALEHWTADAMRRLRRRGHAPERAVVWLADTPPTGCFAALALPLLAGCSVRAKPASADPVSPALFLESLREADAGVAERLRLDADESAIDESEALVAYGSDATLEALRARAGARLFVGYGHRLSAAAIGLAADLDDCAARTALDACAWDGRGCLSPAWVFVDGRERAAHFARALASQLEQAAARLPRGARGDAEEVALRERRAREALRAQAVWLSKDTTDWGVFLGGGAPGALRHLPVVAVDGLAGLGDRCAALAPHLSSLGHEGWGDSDLLALARLGGGSRVCPAGCMQFPPLDWPHDGMPALHPVFPGGGSGWGGR